MGQCRSSLGSLRLQWNTSNALSNFMVRDQKNTIKYVTSSTQALHPYMEDARAAILALDGSRSASFFGVYDGYGVRTEVRKDEEYHNNLDKATRHVFFRMDEHLQENDEWRAVANPPRFYLLSCLKAAACVQSIPKFEGSSASVALIRGYQIIARSVGDSRCVLSRNCQAMELSTNHKPNLPDESQRIENSGGQVTRDALIYRCLGQSGIPLSGYRGNRMLPMYRAIGDICFKLSKDFPPTGQMLTCEPDVLAVDISHDTEFLRIASDGIWKENPGPSNIEARQLQWNTPRSRSRHTVREEDVRIEYALSTMQGLCPYMEDAHAAILDLDGAISTSFFGVYDRYAGANVAQYFTNRVHAELLLDEGYPNDLGNAFGCVLSRAMSRHHMYDFVYKKSENKLANANDAGITSSRNGVKHIPSSEPSPENTVVVHLDDPLEDFRVSYIGGLGKICELCYNNGKRVDISKIFDGHPEMFTTPSSGYFWLKLVFGERHLLFPVIANNLYILGWKGGKGGAFVTRNNDDTEGYNLLEQAKVLSFSENYCDMVGEDLPAVPIGPYAIREAFDTLYWFRGHGHKAVRRALGTIVVNFCEAARFREVSRSISASFSDLSVSVLGENSQVRDYGSICRNSMEDIAYSLKEQRPVKESTSKALAEIRIFNRSGYKEGIFTYEDPKTARSKYQRSRVQLPTFDLNDWFSSEELRKNSN